MSASPDAPTEPNYENPETQEALRDELRGRQKEREQEVRESLSTKEKLEAAREEKKFAVDVDDVPVDFQPLPGKLSRKLMKMGTQWDKIENDPDVSADEALEVVDEFADEVYTVLADYSVDDALTYDWWETTYSLGEAIGIAQRVNQGGAPSPEEVEQFRNQ